MGRSFIPVLIVDDYEPWRRFIRLTLLAYEQLQVIGEVSDGLEAVHQAHQLQPELILLDIGLPELNGIESARRIREVSPTSKILFVCENRAWDIAKEALRTGANGYVFKSNAANELLAAIWAVLAGKQFVSTSLAGRDLNLTDPTDEHDTDNPHRKGVVVPFPVKRVETTRHHVAGFYSDDRRLLDDLTQFAGAALKAGNAAIVVATESHRDGLLARLQAYSLDIGAAIEQGRYVALDAADTLPALMLNDTPDPVRFLELLGDLVVTATEAAKGEQSRVAFFGECVHLLWEQGNAEGAIQMEKLGNQLTKIHNMNILCGYSVGSVPGGMDEHTFQRICAEHSAVHSR
jgi:DNA-binding NarL/FixJ family response regulator